jgi:hypothetical protein
MTSLAQVFVIETLGKLNFSCEVEKIFLSARSNKFLQSKPNQFILCSESSKLKGFVEKRLIKVKSDLHWANKTGMVMETDSLHFTSKGKLTARTYTQIIQIAHKDRDLWFLSHDRVFGISATIGLVYWFTEGFSDA